jgi:hypothetical protein
MYALFTYHSGEGSKQRCVYEPPLNRLVLVPNCISLLPLVTLEESLLLLYKEWRGKRQAYLLLPRTAAMYKDCGATSNVFSAQQAGTCTLTI